MHFLQWKDASSEYAFCQCWPDRFPVTATPDFTLKPRYTGRKLWIETFMKEIQPAVLKKVEFQFPDESYE